MRSRGGRGGGTFQQKRKKRCDRGAACPFKAEHQHRSEYFHEDDAPPVAAGAPGAKRHKSKNDKFAGAGVGHVLDPTVVAPQDGPRCTYCRRSGHNVLSCDAPGADAEQRRRQTKKEAKNAAKVIATRVGTGGGEAKPAEAVVKLPSALPPEYLSRMAVRGEPAAARSSLRGQQDDAYERALQEDLRRAEEAAAKEEEEQMARLLEESRLEAEEAEREKKKRRREELQQTAPAEGQPGAVTLQFHLPDGVRLRRAFWSTDQLDPAVAELLLVEPQLFHRRWRATQLPSREPLLACDAAGRLTTAKPLSVGALGRAAIFVAYDEDDD